MSDFEDDETPTCPLCEEEMDLSDKNFLPCPCGYRVCMWCWHNIRENHNGLCPACRTPYNSDPHAFSAVDRQEIVKKNRERKQREKQDKKVVEKPSTKSVSTVDRRHLHNYRVVQRNLVYIIGLPLSVANEELLKKAEYFGQYGKISKIVVHRNQSISQSTVSAYVTFSYKDDAKTAIQVLDNFVLEGHPLRASFGTTKYCNNFIRNVACNNPDCVYLHDLGDEEDRFTKEEIQAGHTKLLPTPGKDQSIVYGNGGPSGTGKRPIAEPVLPQPVFIQDNPVPPPITPKAPTLSRNTSLSTGIGEIENREDSKVVAVEDVKIVPRPLTTLPNAPSTGELHQVRSEVPEQQFSQDTWNGVTWNAVFPVPASSLSSPVWSTILRASHSNLHVNPFGLFKLPVAEILDLTLPPVDSVVYQPWPRSHQYYMSKSTLDGSKLVPAELLPGKLPHPAPVAEGELLKPNMNALRQIFPGVNLAFGSELLIAIALQKVLAA